MSRYCGSGRNLLTGLIVMSTLYESLHSTVSRAQWPCGLRCDTAAAPLLGMCVRIPTGVSASYRCYVLSGKIYATDWSFVQRSPTDCGVSECAREASIMRRPWPTRGCCAGRGGAEIPLYTIYTTCRVAQCSVAINQWFAIQIWVLKLFWVGDVTLDFMIILRKVINLKGNYRTATWRYIISLH